ncbi:MAG: cysteine--tRNA ligase [Planctomycetota bacterium]
MSLAETPPRAVYVTNTLTGKRELLAPVHPGEIRMYGCGVTTYDYCHVGHALQAVFFDIIRNYLKYAGYRVTYVRNFTDVDDKIINRARERGMSPAVLAAQMVAACQEDMALIGVAPADVEPCVSAHIPAIVAMIEQLIAGGDAYTTASGDVYYRVRRKADYGKLSGRKIEELRTGTRELAGGEEKEFELDFALWKRDDVDGATWDSPWGRGRPGWHIECSAMAKEYLGATFDIHGGGRDLIFPHHENEIAQSESANHAPFALVWLHNGLLTINKQKMSKSLGNHLLIRDAVKRWPAEVLRLSIVSSRYSSNVDFSETIFQGLFQRLNYYYSTLAKLDEAASVGPKGGAVLSEYAPETTRAAFHEAMSDDFNTAVALAAINNAFRRANELLDGKLDKARRAATAAATASVLREIGAVLGLFQSSPGAALEMLKVHLLPQLGVTREEIERLVAERWAAREQRDFKRADELRDALVARGIELRDGRTATAWGVKPVAE